MEESLRRIPPHNLDAEMSLLSLLVNFPEKLPEVQAELKREHFYKRVHQEIFQAVLELDRRQMSIDELVLVDHLKQSQIFRDAGGAAYLAQIAAITPNFNHMSYVKIIVQKSRLRRLIEISNLVLSRSYSEEDADSLVADAEKEILKVAELREEKRYAHASRYAEESWDTVADLVRIRSEGGTPNVGIPTLLSELDSLMMGFKRQDMIVFGARPSMGKTAFCLQLARNLAVEQNEPVILYSLEMPGMQIMMRVLSALAGINGTRLLKGDLNQQDIQNLGQAVARVQESPFFINDQNAMTLLDIKNDLRRLTRELRERNQKLGLVVIDYLQLILSNENKASEQERIAEISRGVKAIAREFDVAVLALSQLSRKVESRQDKRPMLSDLRESGSIEQDADLVLFLHREEYYDPKNEEVKGLAEVLVAKNRNGPTGSAHMRFDKSTARFTDKAREGSR